MGQHRINIGSGDYRIRLRADAVALTLGEPPGQNVAWRFDVFAKFHTGLALIGTLQSASAQIANEPSRVIGYAIAPGAVGWNVRWTGPGNALGVVSVADLHVEPASCSGVFSAPGVYRPLGRVKTSGGALAASRTDATGPTFFRGCFGSNEGSSTLYLMLFDSSTVPANGTQPFDGIALDVPAGGTFNLSLADALFLSNGLTWAVSSTPNTLTLSTSTFRVTTRQEW